MKIKFAIRESFNDIIDQLANSDFWASEIHTMPDKKIIKIKDLAYNLEATAEIYPGKIIIHTAWSNFTYHIFCYDGQMNCEYQGAFRGLLEQKLLPHLTPKGNILDYEVMESSLYQEGERKTLREYARERQQKLKDNNQDTINKLANKVPHSFSDFMKEDMPSN